MYHILPDILIVDGYNLLHGWPELKKLKESSFAHARDKLIEELVNYQAFWGGRIIIVFDSHKVLGAVEKKEWVGPVQIIYSQEGVTADAVIEKLVRNIKTKGRIYVATSDWDEQRMIMGNGALRLPIGDLITDIENARKEMARKSSDTSTGIPIETRIKSAIRKVLEGWRRL
ncbi:MAG: uncharacterized protein PWP31_1528 [Clostridia bacterium]|nr:uncharacterized protein [Clostridia bacterium]